MDPLACSNELERSIPQALALTPMLEHAMDDGRGYLLVLCRYFLDLQRRNDQQQYRFHHVGSSAVGQTNRILRLQVFRTRNTHAHHHRMRSRPEIDHSHRRHYRRRCRNRSSYCKCCKICWLLEVAAVNEP
jgi:hypothetical protein